MLRLGGLKIEGVAARVGTSVPTVSIWSNRFEKLGLDGLEGIKRVAGGTYRFLRSMGRHVGISHSTVQRIWSKNGLKPHITRIFKLSNDPDFEAKYWDVPSRCLSR